MGSKNKKTTSTTRVETKKKKTKNNFAEKAPVKSKNKSKEFNNRKINSSKSLKKDYNEKKPETPLENSNEMSKLIKIVLVVTAIMVVFYGITILATKKADKVKNETRKDTVDTSDVAEIQYDRIIIGTMFNYPGSYYVLIKEKGDNRLDEYESLINTIKNSEDAPRFYTAELSDAFNKKHLAKEENYYPEDLEAFAVKGTTLVKISDNKIESIYDNHEAIKNKLKELI